MNSLTMTMMKLGRSEIGQAGENSLLVFRNVGMDGTPGNLSYEKHQNVQTIYKK